MAKTKTAAQLRREVDEIMTHAGVPWPKPKQSRWDHKAIATRNDVAEDVVRRIYKAVQTAKKQGLYGGHTADLIDRMVGRRLRGTEFTVVTRAKEHLEHNPPGGYQGPKPTGTATEPPRADANHSSYRAASEIRGQADRVIRDVIANPGTETSARGRLRNAADELDVAADLYEDAGAKVMAGTVRERARLARAGHYRKLSYYE